MFGLARNQCSASVGTGVGVRRNRCSPSIGPTVRLHSESAHRDRTCIVPCEMQARALRLDRCVQFLDRLLGGVGQCAGCLHLSPQSSSPSRTAFSSRYRTDPSTSDAPGTHRLGGNLRAVPVGRAPLHVAAAHAGDAGRPVSTLAAGRGEGGTPRMTALESIVGVVSLGLLLLAPPSAPGACGKACQLIQKGYNRDLKRCKA